MTTFSLSRSRKFSRRGATTIAVLAAALLLTACGGGGDHGSNHGAAQTTQANESSPINAHDPWVKAAASGNSALFGTLANNSDKDITITAVSSPAAGSVQMHETKKDASGAMVMSEVKGGFKIPAHGQHELKPGGDHIMLMGLKGELKAGEQVEFTATTSDGSSFKVAAPVKDFSGANENYDHGKASPNDHDHGGHDHSDHDHDHDHGKHEGHDHMHGSGKATSSAAHS
ncbi:copper chaperone PCu(A)C [Dermatophilus congolensis]|uniref:copper chaperone PCu(A)C n=1 Tax=Dermatophilus congolensis TaxID=1863 RepID=UPI001AB056FD|nr:copper chaperone PCu(A)C [Dermatophilus congolensis]MBO3176090.1 copper chaperone PCu(A)C [Dermatophilus congolensis]